MMSLNNTSSDIFVPVNTVNTEKKDGSKGPIETVVIGDDDEEDIICEGVIICDKSQPASSTSKKTSLSTNAPNGVSKIDNVKDVKQNDGVGSVVSQPKPPDTNAKCAEIMETDSVPISKKSECEVTTPDSKKTNGKSEETVATDSVSVKAPVEAGKVPRKVVDLSDDNDEPEVLAAGGTVSTARKSRGDKSNTCINFSCKSGEGLSKAPAFVLTHYGLKNKRNKQQEVCEECFELAVCHQEKVAGRLIINKCLLDTSFPLINDSVIVLDSDEEGSDVEEALLPEVLQSIEMLLPDVMDEALKKYDVDFHIKEAQDYLSNKLNKMELQMEDMDKEIEETQKCLDEWRAEIYKPYQPILKSSESVDIIDVPPPNFSSPPGLTPIQNKAGVSSPKFSVHHTQNVRLARQILEHDLTKQNTPQTQQQQMSKQYQLQQIQLHKQVQQQKLVQQQMLNRQQQQQVYAAAEGKRPSGLALKKVSQYKGPLQKPESQEVVALEDVSVTTAPLPPSGTIRRPRPRVDDIVYVMKTSFFGAWATGRVMEVITKPDQSVLYKVRMDHSNRRAFSMKIVTGRHLAYPNPSPVLLSVGTRVIAIFEDEETGGERSQDVIRQENYYSGLIVEPPKSMNKYRYLVFFDDGYAQYVKHERILLVCESSRNVWEDIHPKSREFIKSYLEQYPERPMVKLQPGQVVKTEWDGKWWIARVIQVDGSLVKMHFDADDRTEWIYRGSTRLAPLYAAQAQAQARAESGTISRMRGLGMATFKKPNTPYVEYTGTGEKEEERLSNTTQAAPARAVAKKSTSKRTDIAPVPIAPRPPPPLFLPEGQIQEIRLPVGVPLPKMFVPHQCGSSCIEWVHFDREKMYSYNPMSIPLLCGWQRELLKYRLKRAVMYTAPCGRRLRNMQELHRYLRLVGSTLTVDLFDFDSWVHALAEYALVNERNGRAFDLKIHDEDLSSGREKVPIPLVNYVDYTRPNPVEYSTTRQPTDGVPLQLNPDPEFLIGCDCTDDCQDKEKCSCWQLTFEGTALTPPGVIDPTVGYQYRRLPERVITGIYECNSRCKCSSTCLNRVVQHPLQLKLQLFKTPDKGWGIRCLNDIPQGTFICIYAGRLLTEQAANEEGAKYGDDYLAELDYIEVVERMKEGYESDVEDDFVDQEDEEESKNTDKSQAEHSNEESSPHKSAKDSDDDYSYRYYFKKNSDNSDESIRSRLRKRTAEDDPMDGSKGKDDDEKRKRLSLSSKDKGSRRGSNEEGASVSDDDEFIRVPSSFTAQPHGGSGESKTKRLQSVRKSFGPKENVYIMDANHMGNIGRYLNHSCSPNVFVQNVFVDTHDLRFPWVAFFALTYIRAGNELTWDYSYDVGSVPDKQIQCRCGSTECRGRLI